MEKQIAELEQAIELNFHMLERMTRPGTPEDERPAARPDGASVPRHHRPLEVGIGNAGDAVPPAATDRPRLTIRGAVGNTPPGYMETGLRQSFTAAADEPLLVTTSRPTHPAAMPRTPAKLPKYNGATPLEPYLSQVQLAARHSGWSDEEAATHLALALEEKALQVLLDIAPAEQRDLQALTMALQRRFGQQLYTDQSREQLANRRRLEGESLGTFAADVQLHARRGYPQFNTAAQEDLALHAFLRGLTPERLRQHVRLAMPKTLREATCEAERAEAVLSTQSTPRRGSSLQPQVRMANYDEVTEEAEEVYQVQPSTRQSQRWPLSPRRRPPHQTDRCYRCDEPGHIARNCPAPAPKTRTTQPAGNDNGVGQ